MYGHASRIVKDMKTSGGDYGSVENCNHRHHAMENRQRLRLWPFFRLATASGLKFPAQLAFKILPATTNPQ